MTSTAQAASRKRFHLFRHKSTDLQKGKQQPVTAIPSNGTSAGSAFVLPRPRPRPQKHQPFDPLELDYRLELYQKEQELLAVKSEHRAAKKTSEDDASLEERNDSGNYSEDKQEMASVDESEEEEDEETEKALAGKEREERTITASAKSEQDKRTETVIRLMGRPRPEQRPSSSHRVRRSQPGTYFPKYAARQFAATTNTTMSAEQPTVTRKSVSSSKSDDDINDSIATIDAASDVPTTPKQAADDDDDNDNNNRPFSRSGPSSNVGPDVIKARRRSAMLPTTQFTSPMAPRATRPRPLSVAALDTLNFWDGGAVCVNPYMPCHEEEDQQQQHQNELVDYTVTTPGADIASSSSALATTGGANNITKAGANAHQRPSLAPHMNDPHNRNDWSQASQCGEGTYTRHNVLHLHSIWRKEKYGASGGVGGGSHGGQQQQQRRQDAGVGGGDAKMVHQQRNAPPNQTMIADAVRVIEERERRKSHPLAFLRRHL